VTGLETRWADEISRALVMPGALDGVIDDSDFGAGYADECARSPWYVALLLRAVLWLVWLGPLVAGPRRLRTFGELTAEEREVWLEGLLAAKPYLLRTGALLLKLTVCTVALGDLRALRQIGAYKLDQDLDQPVQLRTAKSAGQSHE